MKFGSWGVEKLWSWRDVFLKIYYYFLKLLKIIYQIKNNVLICNGFNK